MELVTRLSASFYTGISSATVLAHYNPSLPLRLATDASAYGIGAVISHIFPDGTKRPIAFASRTLSNSEKRYAQLEKEALSLIFGVQKFHSYLYGRAFTLYRDHKPLITIPHSLQPDCNDGHCSWQLTVMIEFTNQPRIMPMPMDYHDYPYQLHQLQSVNKNQRCLILLR